MKGAILDFDLDVISGWAPWATTAIRISMIVVFAWFLMYASQRMIRLFKEYLLKRSDNAEERKRVDTLARVFRYVATFVITVVAGMVVLTELGISIAPILATAGVAGLAIGFGAQSLVKDFFSGFFLLLENQIRAGDVVQVAGKGGFVEEVTLRYVQLRDYDGNVHFIPNGAITTVCNMSRLFAFSVIDVGVAYRENVDDALDVMRQVGTGMRSDAVFGPKIIEDVEIVGVDRWVDSAVILRCRLKVQPLEQWNVRREFLRRLKHAFDAHGIEIPYPHLTVYAGQAKDGTAPPFWMLSAQAHDEPSDSAASVP
jgi:small conductance mechanosensitive channel